MPWPLSQDYNEAIQSPASNFADADLSRGEAVANAIGLPMPYSGNFADVYQVRCPTAAAGRSSASRAKPRPARTLPGNQRAPRQGQCRSRSSFSYLEQGIRVRGQWYPSSRCSGSRG